MRLDEADVMTWKVSIEKKNKSLGLAFQREVSPAGLPTCNTSWQQSWLAGANLK